MNARRGIPLAALAATTVALIPTAAFAGETKTLNTKDIPDYGAKPGFVRASATVAFPSKRAFDVQGWVQDMCEGNEDGDGKGGYLRVMVPVGTGELIYDKQVGKDVNGCGNGKSKFDPAPVKFGIQIHSVTVQLCEFDGGSGSFSSCKRKSFDNWRN